LKKPGSQNRDSSGSDMLMVRWVSDDVVVVVMVAVALIVAMVNPFLDFETSGSGDGVDNNNNNGEFGQERKKAGTPSRVMLARL